MKKTVIAVLLILLSNLLYAQQNNAPYYGFRLGLTAHPNFGFMRATEGKSNGASLGFAYGVMGDFNFAENYSFSTGLTITTMNGKTTERNANFASSNPSSVYDLKYKMRYLELPLSFKFKTDKVGNLKWYGQLGLSNDFKIGAKQDAKLGKIVVADNIDASDWTRFYRAGLIVGGGLEYDIVDQTTLMLGLSLNNGLSNISTGEAKVKNHYVAIQLGVFF